MSLRIRCAWLCVFVGCILATPVVQAVVIKSGNGSGNTTAPEDDPGFANVGRIGVGSGIYLGNRWVLTANHVGARSITFGAETFEHIPEESVRLKNPLGRGLTPDTDLLLLRLADAPDLPDLRIGCRNPRLGDQLVLMGHGRDRSAQLSAWDVRQSSGIRDDVWTPTTNVVSADEVGFRTQSSRSLRWGMAPVTRTSAQVKTATNGDVISIETTFDEFSNTSAFPGLSDIEDLSRAVTGDSGGPVFRKNGDFWELVGMIHGVTPPKENQPGGTATVLFGTVTFIADLIAYEDQIRDVADFGPEPGDFNGNGEIDAHDIDRIFAAAENRDHNCNYDFTDNGLVTRADIDALLVSAQTLPGDANLDGTIGFPDFLLLARSFGEDGAGWGGGDFDGDGSTTFGDFILMSNSFGESFASNTSSRRGRSAAAVPEPNASQMTVVLTALLFAYTRRTRKETTRLR